jgi:glycosyltransferase involved in cell wall biosynthesis
MKPLISVVTAVYNTEKYLEKAINSVLNQTFQDFEYVIVDDGSTDRSPEILQEYADKYPEKIRLFRQPNKGAFHAYNKCTELATGQYIITLNSDDYFSVDCLEIVSSYLIEHGVDIVFINLTTHAADTEQSILAQNLRATAWEEDFVILSQDAVRLSWPFIMEMRLLENNINVYKADIMKRHPYRTDIYGADYMFNIEIANEIKSVAGHPKILYNHFYYVDNSEEHRNISVGKYQPYLHSMYNEFFTKYKELFISWNILDDENRRLLATIRMINFEMEIKRINARNNKMTRQEKISALISYYDDVVAEAVFALDYRSYAEGKIVNTCYELIESTMHSQDEEFNHYMACFIHAVKTEDLSPEVREEMMLKALTDRDNPYALGLSYYEAYLKSNPAVWSEDVVDYFLCRERARAYVLTGRHELAADEITLLFNAPVSDPEKYLLLSMNCFNCGFSDEAVNTALLGLQSFPDYQRLIDAYEQFSSSVSN